MRRVRIASCVCALAIACLPCPAQVGAPGVSNVDKFPYSFTNFVWWTDADLRAILKRRIPGLGDEIGRESAAEARIRTTLVKLLQEKGIQADVQSFEPPLDAGTMKRVAEAPPPSIAFSIAAPPTIAIGTLTFENAPADASKSLESLATALQGRAYNSNTFWHPISEVRENLQAAGYLTATVEIRCLPPAKDGERYVVPLVGQVQPGPQFHVASITADGGPLLQGRDLSNYFTLQPGDIAKPNPFGRLTGSLRAVYWRAGYADVEFQGEPTLDTDKALASYALKVIPGPQYHLRSVAIENLDPVLEAKFRKFIGLQPGDTYDATAIPTTPKMVAWIPELMGYVFSFSPHEDKVAHLVDLTFHFSRD